MQSPDDFASDNSSALPTAKLSRPNWNVVGAIALVLVLLCVVYALYPTGTHRYRLTVEVDTPNGVRSGASVIEVQRSDSGWVPMRPGPRYSFQLHGDAVFIDLGAGRNVIALLAHGPRADKVDQMISLAIEAYGYQRWDQDAWEGRAPMEGRVELRPPLVPTLIAFSDLNDPATAQIVYATQIVEDRDEHGALRRSPQVVVDRFSETFGPDVHFKGAWVEKVSMGIWPLSSFGIVGIPITRGVEQRLPWWTRSGRPAGDARRAWRTGRIEGVALEPESLFSR
jgi:hypothetical protein